MTRVSTFGQNNLAIINMMQIQSTLSDVQIQASTELKDTSYSGLGSDTEVLKALESDLETSANNVANTEMVLNRVETTYSAVGNMIDILANFQVTLSGAISGEAAESAALNENAQTQMESFANQANLQMGGRYLFSGSRTDTAPIDLETYPPQTHPSSVNYDYYQGDDQEASFYGTGNNKTTYGVTADEDAFEKALRAFSLAANASEDPMDEDALLEAYDLVNEALDEMIVIQSELSLTASSLEDDIDMELDYQLKLDAVIGDIQHVDLAAVISEQEQLQVLLEASYNVTASMSKLSLFEYLS